MSTYTLPPGLAEIEHDPNWVNWRLEPRPGDPKPTKMPYTPSSEGERSKAKAGVPTTWGDFATASAAAEAGHFTGLGYEFHAGEGKLLFDLDHVIDPETKKVEPRARAIVALANSYAEISPSGTGIRIVAKGELPRPEIPEDRQGKKKGGFELYGGLHFGTLTFRTLPGYGTLRHIEPERMRMLFALMWPEEVTARVKDVIHPVAPLAPVTLDDAALLDKAFASGRGDSLYQRHQGGYLLEDKSADDWAYLMSLAFWTQRDPNRMRRIAQASGRNRDKWAGRRGGSDLLDYNIAKACNEQHEVYDPERASGSRVVFTMPDDGDVQDVVAIAEALADRDAVIARLEDEKEHLAEQLERCRAEHKRKDAMIAQRDTRCAALEAAISYKDSTMGGAAFDYATAAFESRQRGESRVEEGVERFRVSYKPAANWRSSTTLSNADTKYRTHGVVDARSYPEEIQTEKCKTKVDVAYVAIPEECDTPEKFVLHLLNKPIEGKHGGARRKRELPEFEEPVEGPIQVVTEQRNIYSSVATQKVLKVEKIASRTEYCDTEGYQLTAAEVDDFRVSIGMKVKEPAYRPQPAQMPLSPEDIELTTMPHFDLADEPRRPIPLHKECAQPGCTLPALKGEPLCSRHAAVHGYSMTGAD